LPFCFASVRAVGRTAHARQVKRRMGGVCNRPYWRRLATARPLKAAAQARAGAAHACGSASG